MRVTGIEEVSRSRSRIYLDGSFAFVLYKGELRTFSIREGEELEEASYRQIMEEILPKRASLRCMNLLKSRAYTEKQLRDKLAQGQYPASCVDAALDYVKSYNYVNDLRYAEEYIENQREKKSRRILEQDLLRKGVTGEQIEQAFASQEELGNDPDEEALARLLLKKKHFEAQNATYQEQQKMAAYLYRKGIASGTIHKVLREALEEF